MADGGSRLEEKLLPFQYGESGVDWILLLRFIWRMAAAAHRRHLWPQRSTTPAARRAGLQVVVFFFFLLKVKSTEAGSDKCVEGVRGKQEAKWPLTLLFIIVLIGETVNEAFNVSSIL